MKDQYGKPVPNDLVLLENSDEALNKASDVGLLDWFTVGTQAEIFVSDAEITRIIGSHDFVPFNDVYIHAFSEVIRIDRALKRWNLNDGFYHA